MSYEGFLRDNLIKKQKPDFRQINNQLQRASKDLKTAEANLKIDLTWSSTIAYHAMVRASRALIYSKGYLPTTRKSHKTIVGLTKLMLGHEYDTLISKFNRLGRKRHDFIYDSKNHITYSEAKSALDTAKRLIDKIVELISQGNPKKKPLLRTEKKEK